jgi:hypothetical protein
MGKPMLIRVRVLNSTTFVSAAQAVKLGSPSTSNKCKWFGFALCLLTTAPGRLTVSPNDKEAVSITPLFSQLDLLQVFPWTAGALAKPSVFAQCNIPVIGTVALEQISFGTASGVAAKKFAFSDKQRCPNQHFDSQETGALVKLVEEQ